MAIALAIINECIAKKKAKILWVTPMRALVRDTANQLKSIIEPFFNDIEIVLRTSDSSSYQKRKHEIISGIFYLQRQKAVHYLLHMKICFKV